IIGEIPYKQYTFIGIGPGLGGIEHLNNTIVCFDGNSLNTPEGRIRMLLFLGHEYFHNYNVKRIRPYELGPFDYETENRTNLLWVSEGFTVYYEYLMLFRAGLINENQLISKLEEDINALEQNPGRHYQSLIQASYSTWEDGPFGKQGEAAKRSISYYQKGPVMALLLDFAIRKASNNEKSLDHVMQFLYGEYYIKKNRGFTDAEFQMTCERIAGKFLSGVFEYTSTTKEIDYNAYLNFAGLTLDSLPDKTVKISKVSHPTTDQDETLKGWTQKKH
ncbi:MAG TPA: peptidase M61, partial [Marinilabiliales bacterium]|nr:peptidase M61 [Marinilabiliales bacterium]